jgi:hypothetical protein
MMAVMYASRVFNAEALDDLLREQITEWLIDIENSGGRFRITMTIEDLDGGERRKKLSAKQELRKLAEEMSVSDKNVWQEGDYTFYFLTARYTWKCREIHVTASEGLFLFRWLVLEDAAYFKAKWFLLRNMRKRLGKEFLQEAAREAGDDGNS